ncbi:hypothetical protein NLM31_16550 [Bradyrhizobium sp. CCGUVB4N]|nr:MULTISPECIES: hypothetical protein [unclassified Bradyrhizobium]MCP3381964.1 hypothetical protein [Bradyrhizobium sp. CCGUVB4N]WFU78462.1 hypothetical protein QA645_28485 [Bradyrhizobium sp. CIAT3101]
MSKRLGLISVATSLLLGSAPVVAGSADMTTHRFALSLPGQAPVGHRQPRLSDVAGATQLSSSDLELRRLDAEIDRKLVICRGC